MHYVESADWQLILDEDSFATRQEALAHSSTRHVPGPDANSNLLTHARKQDLARHAAVSRLRCGSFASRFHHSRTRSMVFKVL